MKQKAFFTLFVITCHFGVSQNRAPSCWLNYQDHFRGDILVNTVKVKSPSPTYTYYCNLQWNAGAEGGGYCGMQNHPGGRNFIFSIWDPVSSSEAIAASYTHPGTKVEPFGGEGTGLKSWNFHIGWNTDQWYSFVTRAWSFDLHTMFGFWVYSHLDREWFHIVTMDFPVANVRFNSSTGSFIEDWQGNGWNTREVHHKQGWKRKTSDLSWNPFSSAYFVRVSPDEGAANYIDKYDAGKTKEYFFMKSGGETNPITNRSGTTLNLTNNISKPGFDFGAISELNITAFFDSIYLSWNIDTARSPQFSYHLKIFDNSDFTGSPIIQINEKIPHQRELNIDISSLIDGKKYYFQFYIIDVFDNQSSIHTDSFIAESSLGINRIDIISSFYYYPNPFEDKVYLKFKNELDVCRVQLMDILGNVIYSNEYYSIGSIELNFPNTMNNGVYFLCIFNQNEKLQTIKLLKMQSITAFPAQ